MPSLNARTEGVWWAEQADADTPATTADKQGRKVGGDMTPAREDGSENYSDGNRYTSAADFVNTIVGNGSPVLQAQPGVVGHLAAMALGDDSISGAGDPYEHVAEPGTAGKWVTFWKSVGDASLNQKQKFNKCRITSLRLEASSAAKVAHVTPSFISLDPGEVVTSDPVATLDAGEPMLYTEAVGTFEIDGVVFRGHSSFAVQINDNIAPWYGDDVIPHDVVFGLGNIVVEGVTILVDADGLEYYNKVFYGNANPAAGTRPLKGIPTHGSYEFEMKRGALYVFTTAGSGTQTFTVSGQTTAALAFNAPAATIQAAIEGLSTVGSGQVTVTGTGPYTIVFNDASKVITASAGSMGTVATQRSIKVELPHVKWNADLAINGNPDGGPTELALSAEARKSGSDPMIRITTRNADSAAYVS